MLLISDSASTKRDIAGQLTNDRDGNVLQHHHLLVLYSRRLLMRIHLSTGLLAIIQLDVVVRGMARLMDITSRRKILECRIVIESKSLAGVAIPRPVQKLLLKHLTS